MINLPWLLGAVIIPQLLALAIGAVSAAQGPEALAARRYFYVGGQYAKDGTGMHVMKDQMYVEELVPSGGATQKYPIVFVHGVAQTGTNWLNTPDGRQGWASWFIQRGYTVYIIDQPQRGRSPYLPLPGNGALATLSAEFISDYFTGVRNTSFWPQAHLHTQWPGVSISFANDIVANTLGEPKTGRMGDPIFDAFYASQVQFQNDTTIIQTTNQRAGAALLDVIGPSIVIAHSQGGFVGFLMADARPSLMKALITIEPQGPPFRSGFNISNTAIVTPYGLTNIPITYSPPVENPATDLHLETHPAPNSNLSDCVLQASPAKKLPNLARVPQLVVTSEASYHAQYDYCTVGFLRQAGVDADFLDLPKAGIHGNAHFLFMERNNLEIASRVELWLRGKV